MEQSHGSVRMGPVSLFVLVITLCLAVLAVLSVATAQAGKATALQQLNAITDTYRNEASAQEFMAALDAKLAEMRGAGVSHGEAVSQLGGFLDGYDVAQDAFDFDVPIEAEMEDSVVQADFGREGGRKLMVRARIDDDLSYTILEWRAATEWVEPGSDNILWQG